MGNPAINHSAAAGAAPPSDNGILAYVGGQYIAAGSAKLPAAKSSEPEERTAMLEVPDLGLVRITYRLNSYKHGRSRHWHWLAVKADRVDDQPATPTSTTPGASAST